MSNAPVTRRHREWAFQALEAEEAATLLHEAVDSQEALHFLDTGEADSEKLESLTEEERESYDLFNNTAQAFANFEQEIRAEDAAEVQRLKEHADALDTNWSRFNRISLDTIRGVLGLDDESSVHDMVAKIEQLKGTGAVIADD